MSRTRSIFALFAVGLMLGVAAFGQQGGQKGPAQGKAAPAPAPPLMSCGQHGDIEVLCGARSPEDIEITPDGKYLMVPQFVQAGRGPAQPNDGIQLFDMAAKSYSKMAMTDEPRKDWGDPSCPGPIGSMMVGHGTSLAKRKDGAMELFVVNHGGRQSIEMFELKKGSPWSLVWHGCVPTKAEFNDVAALPDGSFIATHPTILRQAGDNTNQFAGQATGYVARWTAAKGEVEMPNTRAAYPNGVVVDAGQKFMYYNVFSGKEIRKYDLKAGKDVASVKVEFMPDNLTWTPKKQLLGTGVKGAGGECPAGSGQLCIQGFVISQLDPGTMKATTVFDSNGKGPIIGGVSVAFEVGKSIYIGAFQGDRLVKIPR